VDSFCPMEKQYWMLKVILSFYERTSAAMARGISLAKVIKLPVKAEIGRMKELADVEKIKPLIPEIERAIGTLEVER
ncbi:MAG: V-type ATP synthase subunit A, partial [Methanomicrobiales archaeon]|nr:V-type ATP synthase subunit A [Methanomicrobiales archaeon]